MSDRDERLDAEEMELPQEEVVLQGDQGWLANSPWWLISTGIHAVLLLAASLYYIEKNMPIDDSEVAVVVGTKPPPLMQEIERPRDVFERKGIPKDEPSNPAAEPAIFFPEAKESDHNESDDNEDYHEMKGESKDFFSHIRGGGEGIRGTLRNAKAGVYGTLGVGGG